MYLHWKSLEKSLGTQMLDVHVDCRVWPMKKFKYKQCLRSKAALLEVWSDRYISDAVSPPLTPNKTAWAFQSVCPTLQEHGYEGWPDYADIIFHTYPTAATVPHWYRNSVCLLPQDTCVTTLCCTADNNTGTVCKQTCNTEYRPLVGRYLQWRSKINPILTRWWPG